MREKREGIEGFLPIRTYENVLSFSVLITRERRSPFPSHMRMARAKSLATLAQRGSSR